MWAVFHYSTGKIVCYFTDERDAKLYAEDQCRLDEALGYRGVIMPAAPDWGWMFKPLSEATRELLEG